MIKKKALKICLYDYQGENTDIFVFWFIMEGFWKALGFWVNVHFQIKWYLTSEGKKVCFFFPKAKCKSHGIFQIQYKFYD